MLSGPLQSQRAEFLPNVIHGDLDSLRKDAQDYYTSQGVHISRDPDQESTDFGKAIHVLTEGAEAHQDIVILSSLGGRVDQGLGLLHELFREYRNHPDVRLWLFSESSVSFILPPGVNVIYTALPEKYFTPNVGIIPVFGPAVISTTGLEWDVKNWKTSMGTQVSTSNHVVEEPITIETNEIVLFTIERASLPA